VLFPAGNLQSTALFWVSLFGWDYGRAGRCHKTENRKKPNPPQAEMSKEKKISSFPPAADSIFDIQIRKN
jgi:hypothetical protein